MTNNIFVYAMLDINTFYIHAISHTPICETWPTNYQQIKIIDIELINSILSGDVHLPIKFNRTHYPAIMKANDILAFKELMHTVPENSIVVEVGSAYGGSAYAAAETLSSNTILYCIDNKWKSNSKHKFLKPKILNYLEINHNIFSFNSMYDFAKDYLSKWPNVKLIPANSPDDMHYWNTPIDLLFEDSSHKNPQLKENLEFWLPFIKSGGIISGHDYNDLAYPEVTAEVQNLAKRLNQPVYEKSHIWWIYKP